MLPSHVTIIRKPLSANLFLILRNSKVPSILLLALPGITTQPASETSSRFWERPGSSLARLLSIIGILLIRKRKVNLFGKEVVPILVPAAAGIVIKEARASNLISKADKAIATPTSAGKIAKPERCLSMLLSKHVNDRPRLKPRLSGTNPGVLSTVSGKTQTWLKKRWT